MASKASGPPLFLGCPLVARGGPGFDSPFAPNLNPGLNPVFWGQLIFMFLPAVGTAYWVGLFAGRPPLPT